MVSLFLSMVAFVGYIAASVAVTMLTHQHPKWLQSQGAMMGLNLLPLVGLTPNFSGIAFGVSGWYQRDHRRGFLCLAIGANVLLLLTYSALTIVGSILMQAAGRQ